MSLEEKDKLSSQIKQIKGKSIRKNIYFKHEHAFNAFIVASLT